SRKAEDDEARKAIKERLRKLPLPEEHGVIVRTNGLTQNQTTLNRDLNALLRLWRKVNGEAERGKGPKLIYSDQDLVVQSLRDYLDPEISEVVVDNDEVHAKAEAYMKAFMPRSKTLLTRYDDRLPLFSRYRLETQIDRIYERSTPLPGGGSIVIDGTEALTAIDVNSGRATRNNDHDESILAVNVEAAKEVARQLRLRDIGGLVVVDFIDMRLRRHQSKLEKAMRDSMKIDKARYSVGRISSNGLLEINRQRIKQALKLRTHRECPTCAGTGSIPTPEFVALRLLSRLEARASLGTMKSVTVALHPQMADEVQNHYRRELTDLERAHNFEIEIIAAPTLRRGEERIEWIEREGAKVELPPAKTKTAVISAGDVTDRRRGRDDDDESSARRRRRRRRRKSDEMDDETLQAAAAEVDEADDEASQTERPSRRRGRRRSRRRRSEVTEETQAVKTGAPDTALEMDAEATLETDAHPASDADEADEATRRGGRRRRRRRRRGRAADEDASTAADEPTTASSHGKPEPIDHGDSHAEQHAADHADGDAPGAAETDDPEAEASTARPSRRRRRSRRRKTPDAESAADPAVQSDIEVAAAAPASEDDPAARASGESADAEEGGRRRRRRRGGRRRRRGGDGAASETADEGTTQPAAPANGQRTSKRRKRSAGGRDKAPTGTASGNGSADFDEFDDGPQPESNAGRDPRDLLSDGLMTGRRRRQRQQGRKGKKQRGRKPGDERQPDSNESALHFSPPTERTLVTPPADPKAGVSPDRSASRQLRWQWWGGNEE
ncbi:MAG: ribonuclease E/G, partial [Acidobacteriota bacterium]